MKQKRKLTPIKLIVLAVRSTLGNRYEYPVIQQAQFINPHYLARK